MVVLGGVANGEYEEHNADMQKKVMKVFGALRTLVSCVRVYPRCGASSKRNITDATPYQRLRGKPCVSRIEADKGAVPVCAKWRGGRKGDRAPAVE